ncbi:hypothetical protein R6Z07M_004598 [Ovis aries]
MKAPLSMGFSRQEYWSGLPIPSPGIFPTQGWNSSLLHWKYIYMVENSKGIKSYTVTSCMFSFALKTESSLGMELSARPPESAQHLGVKTAKALRPLPPRGLIPVLASLPALNGSALRFLGSEEDLPRETPSSIK